MKKFTQNFKVSIIAAGLMLFGAIATYAAEKNARVWSVKTNTGHYYPIVNVSMLVVPDDGKTFEIVLKYGEGEAGVTNISFEQHMTKIDFDLYIPKSGGEYSPNLNQYLYMITNTGKYFMFKNVPTLKPVPGTEMFDVVYPDVTEKNVSKIHFVRTDNIEEYMSGIETPMIDEEEELTLQTPIESQMTISGCGNAKVAEVYSLNGTKMTQSAVNAGATTVQVGDLTPGMYVVKVGKKSLKFVKK